MSSLRSLGKRRVPSNRLKIVITLYLTGTHDALLLSGMARVRGRQKSLGRFAAFKDRPVGSFTALGPLDGPEALPYDGARAPFIGAARTCLNQVFAYENSHA